MENLSEQANKSFTICHWNCNKFTEKRKEELSLFLANNKPDVLSLNEIKLDKNLGIQRLNFAGYHTIFRPRKSKKASAGGAIALLIKKSPNLSYSELDISNNRKLEIVGVCLTIESKKILIFSYYNPPHEKLNSVIFKKIESFKIDYIMCGDFNSKMMCYGSKADSQNGRILVDLMKHMSGNVLKNSIPTYHKFCSRYSEVLDMFICSPFFINNKISLKVLNENFMSDHNLVEVTFELSETRETILSDYFCKLTKLFKDYFTRLFGQHWISWPVF